jgi:hypothetical protein
MTLPKQIGDREYQKFVETNLGETAVRTINSDLGRAAFGELSTISDTPVVQIDAVYGLRTKTDVETFTASGGSVGIDDSTGKEFVCTSGTTQGGYGLIRSKRELRYRAGQGAETRFTARFDAPVANHLARAGLITSGNELSFGYNGGSNLAFGIFYRTGGKLEIQTLEITAAASGNETATVTLNGTTFDVAVTSGTTKHNAFELGASTYAGYTVTHNGSKITFAADSLGNQTGTFSLSSTGTLAGTFTETAAGQNATDTFIEQADWNIDAMDGAGSSGMTLDAQKGNVYKIDFQYLGYGALNFYVENSNTGLFQKVHQIKFANTYTKPSLLNPTFKIGWFSANTTGTTSKSIYGASGALFLQGIKRPFRDIDSHENEKSISTTETNILSIRNRSEIGGTINLTEILLEYVSFAVEGTKPAVFRIYKNATLGGEPDWTYHDENESPVEYDTAGTTVTNVSGTTIELGNFALGKSDSLSWDFSKYNVVISRNDVITISGRTISGTSDMLASISWLED